MVVGVDWFLGAHGAAQNLDGAVRNDFIAIHVGLGSRAGLPDNEGEMVNELKRCDFRSSLLDSLAYSRIFQGRKGEKKTSAETITRLTLEERHLPSPYLMFTVAAAPLRIPKALTMGGGIRSCGWLISKLVRDLHNSPPAASIYIVFSSRILSGVFMACLPLGLGSPVFIRGDLYKTPRQDPTTPYEYP